VLDAERPNITVHPQNRRTHINGNVKLLVVANVGDGGTLSFQWFRNTVKSNTGGTAIAGATNINFWPSTKSSGTVYYYVVITNTNTDGSITGSTTTTYTSAVVAVTVSGFSGAVIGGIIGGVSATLAGLFAAYWFVIRKRKKTV